MYIYIYISHSKPKKKKRKKGNFYWELFLCSQEFGPRRTPTGYRSAQQQPITTANTPPPRSYRQQQNTSTVVPFDNDDDDYSEFSPGRGDYNNRNHEAIEMQPTQNQRTRPPPNLQNMEGFFQEVRKKERKKGKKFPANCDKKSCMKIKLMSILYYTGG